MQKKVTPCLWFDTQAEEAARFYVSVFPDARLGKITHYTGAGPAPVGAVMTVTFHLQGQELMALNGGPHFKHSPAVSFVIHCDTQAELDALWEALPAGGGAPGQCGWVEDRFGVSWQLVPSTLERLIDDAEPERSRRVMEAVLQMRKLDLAALERAYAG